ncbi:MAG: hypothetical protein ACOCVC_03880, partial [Spirochaeta sp.]
MLLFRVITPILWYWAVRDMAGDSPRKARPGIAAIAAALAAGLFSLLLNAVSIEYTYTGVFVYHLIVYWLPLLCLSPLLLLTVKRLRHASGIPFMSALSGQ